ncbi:hypothetical protein C9374_005786 [Naegleria lovaniensis]|uniref:Exonuclease domain-containing protein n=1 Tax=Naegleria lovaniensis TaxID=51637 RepID=A0AA88KHN7_NAELO|nr:uncharacterized protein C9374_005786 [Naegleria lovaniensis]KAG2381994.1 hypothetical protein C9374_005786 [Naegleria lovaniensis]
MTKKRSLPSWMMKPEGNQQTSSSTAQNSAQINLQPSSNMTSQSNANEIKYYKNNNNEISSSDQPNPTMDINFTLNETNRDKFSPFEMQKKRSLEQAEMIQDGVEPQIKFSKPNLSKDLVKEFVNFYTSCPRVIVLDCETSGFSKSDQVIELAAVELKHGIRTGKLFSSRVKLNNGVSIHEKAQQVHKITERDLLVHPPSSLIIGEFLEFLGEDTSLKTGVVAHNLKFDIRMIKQDIEKYCGHRHVPMVFQDSSRQFCTMQFHKNARGKNASYDLDSACHYFGISRGERDEAHSALQDAEITAQLFLSLKEYVEWESNEESVPISSQQIDHDNAVAKTEPNEIRLAGATEVFSPFSENSIESQFVEEESSSNRGIFSFFRKLFWY